MSPPGATVAEVLFEQQSVARVMRWTRYCAPLLCAN